MKHPIGTNLIRVTGFCIVFEGPPKPYEEISQVVKHTAKGMWLKRPYSSKLKFQLNEGGRYASLTLDDAINSFRHRRIRYIGILESNLASAKLELETIHEWLAHKASVESE